MSFFAGKVGAIGRRHFAKRPLSGLPINFLVSRATGGLLEEFGAFDCDRLDTDRVLFERAIPQRVVYLFGMNLLQSLTDHKHGTAKGPSTRCIAGPERSTNSRDNSIGLVCFPD